MRARDALRALPGRPVKILPELRSEWLYDLVKTQGAGTLGSTSAEFQLFNLNSNAARLLLRSEFFLGGGASPHLLFAGFGQMGAEILVRAIRCNFAMPGQKLSAAVLDERGDASRAGAETRCAGLSELADISFTTCPFLADDASWQEVALAELKARVPLAVIVALKSDVMSPSAPPCGFASCSTCSAMPARRYLSACASSSDWGIFWLEWKPPRSWANGCGPLAGLPVLPVRQSFWISRWTCWRERRMRSGCAAMPIPARRLLCPGKSFRNFTNRAIAPWRIIFRFTLARLRLQTGGWPRPPVQPGRDATIEETAQAWNIGAGAWKCVFHGLRAASAEKRDEVLLKTAQPVGGLGRASRSRSKHIIVK